MSHLKDYSDDRNKGWCIHCHDILSEETSTRDHVPSRALLKTPLPQNLPVVFICSSCNKSYSLDEEYLMALMEVVLTGTTDPQFIRDEKVKELLQRNVSLRRRIENSKVEIAGLDGKIITSWKPEIERVSNVLLKNARGHIMYELGEPMLEAPVEFNLIPFISMNQDQRNAFENNGSEFTLWPEVGSRMMARIIEGTADSSSWVNIQDGIYKYSVTIGNGIRVRSVLRDYLASEIIWD